MTNMYLAQIPAYSMVDSTKGSFSNRAECAKEHFKNNVGYAAKSVALGAGTGAVAYGVFKNPKLVDKAAVKTGDFLVKFANKLAKTKYFSKLGNFNFNKIKLGKAGLLALAITTFTAICNHLAATHTYKSGQIDQKYTDVAILEKNAKNPLLR